MRNILPKMNGLVSSFMKTNKIMPNICHKTFIVEFIKCPIQATWVENCLGN